MSSHAMAPGCWRTGGSTKLRKNRRVDGSTTGKSPVMTRGVGAGEHLGEKTQHAGPNYHRRWYSNGRQAGSHVKMIRGWCRARLTTEKTAHNDFFYFKSFFQYEILHGDSF
jgi:hypothetical protein